MTRTRIPDEVLTAAHERAAARAAKDWATADRLRAEIEAAGWTVVDRGTDFALSPAAPPDIEEGAARPLRGVAQRPVAAGGDPGRAGDGRPDRHGLAG